MAPSIFNIKAWGLAGSLPSLSEIELRSSILGVCFNARQAVSDDGHVSNTFLEISIKLRGAEQNDHE